MSDTEDATCWRDLADQLTAEQITLLHELEREPDWPRRSWPLPTKSTR
jgi:hypothetical protein